MPPRKQPKTLQEIALNKVACLTNKLCFDIEEDYGGWNCPASRNKLELVKKYLSAIQPLFDDLCDSVFNLVFYRQRTTCQQFYRIVRLKEKHDAVNDKRMLLEILLCDKLKRLNLGEVACKNNCFVDSVFWTNQLLKLKNLEQLDILKVRLTDASFKAIGDVCRNLRVIRVTSDLHFACMNSLKHLLNCIELRVVRIDFRFWSEECRYEYIGMFTTDLPKLEHFYNWSQWSIYNAKAITTPMTSMREIHLKSVNSTYLLTILRLCPNLKDIRLGVHNEDMRLTLNYEEMEKVLKVLAKSSLQLNTLYLNFLIFNEDLARLISSNCSNLTKLHLDNYQGRRISVNNIYTIGLSCPVIKDLRIIETDSDSFYIRYNYVQLHSPNLEQQTFDTTPRMFVHLKVLFLRSTIDWDQRILPLILRHANDLTNISLRDIFKPTSTSVDVLSEILNHNALRELECLNLNASFYNCLFYNTKISFTHAHTIERLLDSCPKLKELHLMVSMDRETVRYLQELKRAMKRDQFEFSLDFLL